MYPVHAGVILFSFLVSGYHGSKDDAGESVEGSCIKQGGDESCQDDQSPTMTSILKSCPHSCFCVPKEDQSGIIVNCTLKKLLTIPSTLPSDTVELVLSNNKIEIISTLPPSALLKDLYLDHNQIHQFDVNLKDIAPKLDILDLSNNQLVHIPSELPPSVTILKLTDNNIQSCDLSLIGHLTDLSELYLDQNVIESLPSSFSDSRQLPFSHLTKLALSGNYISEIGDAAFAGLRSLKALTLSRNKINALTDATFKGLINLGFLDLKKNKIDTIANNTFKGMKSLKYLYLGNNYVKEVPLNLPFLDWLDLSHNQISVINESLSKTDMYPIDMINLAHNPLHCDCKLLWLKELWDRREYILKYMDVLELSEFVPVCASPAKVAGDSWDMLGDNTFECPEVRKPRVRKVKKEDRSPLPEDEPIDDRLIPRSVSNKDIRLSVAVGRVTEEVVTLHWRNYGVDECEWVFIQYYIFGHRDATTLLAQVAYSSGHYRINHLKPGTNYILCIVPKVSNEITLGDTHLNSCVEVATLKEDIVPPVKGWLAYMPDDMLLTYFIKLISSCFIVSLCLVGFGVAVYEILMKLAHHVRGDGPS